MLKNLLMYRLVLFNALSFYGLFVAYQMGWLHKIVEADASGIVYAISALFIVVLLSTFRQGWKVSKYINQIKAAHWIDDGFAKRIAGQKRLHKLTHIDRAAGWMTTLGLIGTVVGFILAFMGINMDLVGSASGVQQIATQLVTGMGTALVTTLVGACAGLWTEVNYKMIVTPARVILED